MKKGYFWIIVLVCISICVSATADAYILHTPTSEQIQEDEATQIALDFIKSMTGIELTGLFRVEDSRKVEGKVKSFDPGYQWYYPLRM